MCLLGAIPSPLVKVWEHRRRIPPGSGRTVTGSHISLCRSCLFANPTGHLVGLFDSVFSCVSVASEVRFLRL